jgi:cytochrome d ubiquinol oxidase subunit II
VIIGNPDPKRRTLDSSIEMPHVLSFLTSNRWNATLGGQFAFQRRGSWGRAFVTSAVFIVGLLTTMAAGLYPSILPAHEHRPFGLTVDNAASSEHALTVGLRWWSLGIVLAIGYFIVAYRFVFARRP